MAYRSREVESGKGGIGSGADGERAVAAIWQQLGEWGTFEKHVRLYLDDVAAIEREVRALARGMRLAVGDRVPRVMLQRDGGLRRLQRKVQRAVVKARIEAES